MDDLIDLAVVVRRVVAARVRDPGLIEDLTQETLLQVASADPRLGPDARQAYAITTARHLIISHARSEAIHDRHAHRLVDYTSLDGPEQLSLQRDETDALAAAIDKLPAADRELLLQHEVEGATTEELATAADTSSGAIAMRLARARALLRVEFLLAFRRVELPTQRCRPVLVALSSGDRRVQHRLHADEHLRHCPTCDELARPVAHRSRRIAAWLIVPVAEAVRRAARSLRHNHVTQIATVVATVGALTVAVMASGNDRPETSTQTPQASLRRPAATASPTSAAAGTTSVAVVPAAAAPSPTPVPAPPSSVLTATPQATCPAPVPVDQLDPATPLGCPVAPTALTVIDVPFDEGFWAQTEAGAAVFVQLTGDGESAMTIESGTPLTVSGSLRPPPPDVPISTDPRTATATFLDVAYDAVMAH